MGDREQGSKDVIKWYWLRLLRKECMLSFRGLLRIGFSIRFQGFLLLPKGIQTLLQGFFCIESAELSQICLYLHWLTGLAILGTFKFGSIGMGFEAYKYACNVKWLGV
ncbi:uncharacterized protein LOC113347703 [Papaver somniferum]|uniref:uncharacterized protein LOC113347703 n=1 Tax=Papaver somniferum TaxID=3469 RepID=UPI000E6F9965|nr:uncharacterized protein LOC113347703 [Papaver somniferum]